MQPVAVVPSFKHKLTILCNQSNRRAQNTLERASWAVQSAALRALYERSKAGEDPAVVLQLLVQAWQMLSKTDRRTADQATAAEQ